MTLDEKWNRHLAAATRAGQASACGKKINYGSEDSAARAAGGMNKKKAALGDSKLLEPYPCPFCAGWHIGRQMSEDELAGN